MVGCLARPVTSLGIACSRTLVASSPSASPPCCRAWSYSWYKLKHSSVATWTSLSSAQLLGFGGVHQSLVRLCRRLGRNGQAHLSSASGVTSHSSAHAL